MRYRLRNLCLTISALILTGYAATVQAHIIDRIEIEPAGNEAEIQIMFDTRIQYLRDASLGNGEIHIYFNLLEPDPSPVQPVSEAKESPPSSIAPHFTVSYPELDSALDIKFDQQIEYRVRPGKDGRSISVFVPAVQSAAAESVIESSAPAMRSQEEIEKEAVQLLDGAQKAMAQGQPASAIETLNRLLNLPPNEQSQPAQRLIGEARQKNGEYAKARVEYELYLKLYPDAADAAIVKKELAGLPAESTAKPEVAQPRKPVEERMMVYGSLSQNYYKGVLHTDNTNIFNGQTSQSSWSGTDQSLLITSLDITGRKRTATTDTRLVVRDDHSADFLNSRNSVNRLGAAYVEQNARDQSYMFRIGRQTGNTGGVLGRFDGAWVGYELTDIWRINAVAGTPVDYYNSIPDRRTFGGISIDLTRLPAQWSGNAYLIQQRVAGVKDRQAVGMEAHYFDTQQNYIASFDYDTIFRAVNIATFQANWMASSGGNYNLLLDHRKSPPLQLTNALPGLLVQSPPISSVSDALSNGYTVDSLRQSAQALTSITNLAMIGTTQPYSSRWRIGGDFRISNTSGISGVGTPTPGTGNIYMITAQAFGNNLIAKDDLGTFSANLIKAQDYTGYTLSFDQMEVFAQHWRMDALLQLYRQSGKTGDPGYRWIRITPAFKLGYRVNDSVSLEGEAGMESSRDNSSISGSSNSQRRYFYIGYRWDFQ